tara:strand:- start:785 stop:985 length:201 start_codon:yes stop_codon:yes gene_type:complete
MKTKLLKKARRKVKFYKRNGLYYVDSGNYMPDGMTKERALDYYRVWVIKTAKDIFGFKPKSQFFKY